MTVLFSCLLSVEEWNFSADVSLIINQNAFSNNWVGDEKGSVSWTTNSNFTAEKQLSLKLHYSNSLQLAFGQTYTQSVNEYGDKRWGNPEKTTDIIDFETIFRLTLGKFVDPFASFGWESRFVHKNDNRTKYLNPNILSETIGAAKFFIKTENRELSTRLGASFKQYFDRYANGSTNDGGLEFVGIYRSPFADNVISYNSKLTLYQALFYSESDKVKGTDYEDNWKTLRLNWENNFTVNITSLLNMKLLFQLLYDETVLEEFRFKQTLGLGFTYVLF